MPSLRTPAHDQMWRAVKTKVGILRCDCEAPVGRLHLLYLSEVEDQSLSSFGRASRKPARTVSYRPSCVPVVLDRWVVSGH